MEIKGSPTIHPWLFYPGKTAGYLTWFFAFLIWLKVIPGRFFPGHVTGLLTWIFLFAGVVIITISLIGLGNSVRIGLPKEKTTLKTGGIYRVSRNPMYVGVHLLSLASMVYTCNPFIILAGIFSFWVYHRIILGEEKFLEERFGEHYRLFKKKVRRYL